MGRGDEQEDESHEHEAGEGRGFASRKPASGCTWQICPRLILQLAEVHTSVYPGFASLRSRALSARGRTSRSGSGTLGPARLVGSTACRSGHEVTELKWVVAGRRCNGHRGRYPVWPRFCQHHSPLLHPEPADLHSRKARSRVEHVGSGGLDGVVVIIEWHHRRLAAGGTRHAAHSAGRRQAGSLTAPGSLLAWPGRGGDGGRSDQVFRRFSW